MAFAKGDKMETGFLTGLAYFAQVHYPQDKFNTKKFVLQLALEGAELEKAKKEYKLNIKAPSQHVPFPHVEVKRNYKGPQTKDPEIIDAINKPIPKTVSIGNGSLVKVKIGIYDDMQNRKTNGAYMDTVKVVKLVEYKGGGRAEEAEFMAVQEDGFGGILPDVKSESEDDVPFTPTNKPVKSKITTTG